MRQLKYFLKVADVGGISKASIQLNVTQSAVSAQIASLEDELGSTLFLRRSRGVEITDAGRILYRHARTILRQSEIAREEVAHSEGVPSGTVSLGLPSAMAEMVGMAMIRACAERLPLVRLRIVEGVSSLLVDFMSSGRLDISILFVGQAPAGLKAMPVLEEELFYVCSPRSAYATAGKTAITLADAVQTPLVMPEVGNSMRRIVDAACAKAGIGIEPVAELDSLILLKACVAQDVASTFLPWSVVSKEEAAGDVHVMRVKTPAFSRPLSICTSSQGARGIATDVVTVLLRTVIIDLVKGGAWQGVTLSS
ncbi:LysR substrate-binding domain-containing protein [Sphingobium terrigena]|nr:LysR substrate-binding domain-containing protein [Sphingobium terrigena]